MPTPAPQILDRLRENPAFYLREINFRQNRAGLVHMDEAAYRASAFLGGSRLVTLGAEEFQVPLDALVERCATARGPMHFLFHIGHCGSTLLSRMLGELPGLFSQREPRPLMSLAQYRRAIDQPGYDLTKKQWREYLHAVLALLSRTWRDSEVALVKPNSHSNNQMLEEMTWAEGRAVLLQLNLETWLATVLKPDKRDELRHFSQLRVADLTNRFPEIALPPTIPDEQRAAVIWLVELLEFQDALEQHGDRCLRVDFDAFLENPARHLAMIARHLNVGPDDRLLAKALMIMTSEHAKHPDRNYDPGQRQTELNENRKAFTEEIATARDFASGLCGQHPVLAIAAGEWI